MKWRVTVKIFCSMEVLKVVKGTIKPWAKLQPVTCVLGSVPLNHIWVTLCHLQQVSM